MLLGYKSFASSVTLVPKYFILLMLMYLDIFSLAFNIYSLVQLGFCRFSRILHIHYRIM